MNDDAQQPPAIDARAEAREEPRERLPNDPPVAPTPPQAKAKGLTEPGSWRWLSYCCYAGLWRWAFGSITGCTRK